jgi:hypothetical protein
MGNLQENWSSRGEIDDEENKVIPHPVEYKPSTKTILNNEYNISLVKHPINADRMLTFLDHYRNAFLNPNSVISTPYYSAIKNRIKEDPSTEFARIINNFNPARPEVDPIRAVAMVRLLVERKIIAENDIN